MNQTNKTKINFRHSWNYFLKRTFSKKSTL